MAIEHQNIAISEASAAAAAVVAQDAWRDALLDHVSGNWTLEEEFDSSGSTVHWVVVKNTGGAGVNFWVCIGRVAADGTMGCFVGEDYVAASNLLSKFAPRCDNTGYILGNNYHGGGSSTDPATFTLGTALPNANSQPLCTPIAGASTERLFTSVEADYAVLNVNGVSMYVGAMTDLIVPKTGLVATPAIACADLGNGNVGRWGAITQHPIAAADAPLSLSGAHCFLPAWGGGYEDICAIQDQARLTALYGYPDRYQSDRVAASEVAGVMASAINMGYSLANARADKAGGLRAKFKGIRITTGPVAAVTYDDIVVDGKKAVVMYTMTNLDSPAPYVQYLAPYNHNTVVRPMFVMDTGLTP